MSKAIPYLLSATLAWLPLAGEANCSLEQTACEARCKVTHLNDTTSKNTCLAKCAAERAACSTKEGAAEAAEKAAELGSAALEKAKSWLQD